ncbi:MAG TPA: hypothetical protein VHG29_09640 [Novosphingobium sp.]|nr:hypothetical protein [Novosphingobium sp.]
MDLLATVNAANPTISKRRIAASLARIAYAEGRVRVASKDLSDCECLVACTLGLFAINRAGLVRRLLYGFFHGIRRYDDHLLIFEIGDRPRLPNAYGRVLRIPVEGQRLGKPAILVQNLDNRCHQLALFDGLIHVIDTAHQQILRFTPDGGIVDAIQPFPFTRGVSPESDYLHINSIARIGNRIALMLHNGAEERPSELAWFDPEWALLERHSLPGLGCHDIVADGDGTLWHCGSMDGELINSRGERYKISDRMTRGLAITPEGFAVGASTFGAREVRDNFTGSVLFLDRETNLVADVLVPAAPMDLIALTPRG